MMAGGCYVVIGCYLAAVGIVDIKKREVDIRFLMAGFLIALTAPVLELMFGDETVLLLLINTGGGLMTGLVFLAVSVMTREEIGRADALVLCQTGIAFGLKGNLVIIGSALILSLPTALFMLVVRKAGKKSRIPFIPLIFFGFVVLCWTEYMNKP